MDRLVGVCYGFLALLNLWISLTGLAHAHLLTLREASPILGEASSPHIHFGAISVHVHLAAIAAFVLSGALNLLAGGWVAVQAWVATRAWVATPGGEDTVGIGNTISGGVGEAGGLDDAHDGGESSTNGCQGRLGESLALAIFAAAVAGTLILAGAVNLTAANRVRRAGIGRGVDGAGVEIGRGEGSGRYGGEKEAGIGRKGRYAVIGMGEKC